MGAIVFCHVGRFPELWEKRLLVARDRDEVGVGVGVGFGLDSGKNRDADGWGLNVLFVCFLSFLFRMTEWRVNRS